MSSLQLPGLFTGIDISAETIRLCNLRRITGIVQCDAMALPFSPDSFDLVLERTVSAGTLDRIVISELEGIIPALESSHAIAYLEKMGDQLTPDTLVVVNLSGRGDKDVEEAAAAA